MTIIVFCVFKNLLVVPSLLVGSLVLAWVKLLSVVLSELFVFDVDIPFS